VPAHKSHRGNRHARKESESLLDVSLDECALFFLVQAIVKKTFAHPLNRPPSMGGEDEHAVRGQMVGKKVQKGWPLLATQVGEKRSAPNQIERLVEADTADILLRINRRRIELGRAEIHCIAVEIADRQMGIRKRRSQDPTDTPVPGWQVEDRRWFDVGGSEGRPDGGWNVGERRWFYAGGSEGRPDAIQRGLPNVVIPLRTRVSHVVIG
jgi:hypothetical protein